MRCGRGVVGSSIVVGVGWEERHRSRGQLWARKGCMLTLLVTVLTLRDNILKQECTRMLICCRIDFKKFI